MLFYVFGFLVIRFCSGSLTGPQRAGLLERHNHYRRVDAQNGLGSGMIEMEWDYDLEVVAQKFADLGEFTGHNSNRKEEYEARVGPVVGVGENWFSGAPIGGQHPMPEDAVHAWVDFVWPGAWTGQSDDCSERQAFNGQCSGMTGHFTQVLWEKSYKVGCGYNPLHGTTCNYWPPGNFNSEAHANSGTACETCPSTHIHCANSLCRAAASTPTPTPSPIVAPPPTPPTPSPTPSPISSCTYSTINWLSDCPTGYLKSCDGWCVGPLASIQILYNPNAQGSLSAYNLLVGYNINLNCPRFCCGLEWESGACGVDTAALGGGAQEGTQMARRSDPVYIESSVNNRCVYWSMFFLLLSSIYMFL